MKKYHNNLKRKNYEAVGKSCTACNKQGEGMVGHHHIYSRGSHKEYQNEPWNMIPLCGSCHSRIHTKGDLDYFRTHYKVRFWMLDNGWYEENDKLFNKNAEKA